MDSKKFDAAVEAALADEIGKINNLLPMVDVKNMMRIRAVVERFIDRVKEDPNKGEAYPSINWGDFQLVSVEKVIPLNGDHYYSVLCEEGQCSEMNLAIHGEVGRELGIAIAVRTEW